MDEPDQSCTTAHTPNDSHSSARLMVVGAATYNFNTKMNQRLMVLLDSGSQHSYIRKSIAIQLGLVLEKSRLITTIAFGGHRHTEESFLVHLTLQDQYRQPFDLELWTRETITSIPRSHCPSEETKTPRAFGEESAVDIDVLIGINYYWEAMTPINNQKLDSGLILSHTRFGPVLSGTQNSMPSHTHCAGTSLEDDELTSKTDRMIRQLFELESAGITEESEAETSEIIQHYYNTVIVKDGLIYVKFPWKSHHPHLPGVDGVISRGISRI
ncbi:hypothetical protein ANCCEY_15772 [Ancylostoma ceylanicum]|uniref:Uncharacterized protein n=1 Tax=Ancylostoma ceylanicum TaxID=53326 RepID=A0A0D6L3B0_9BILA|nr:hypothetical protein ANCCEY_15772 [Ancylostoma ceylanicum]